MEKLLEPFDGPIRSTRNGTELSALCEKLVASFVANRASAAKVRCDRCGYGADEMYKCLWQITGKRDWKDLVKVHKQDGDVLLVRKAKE